MVERTATDLSAVFHRHMYRPIWPRFDSGSGHVGYIHRGSRSGGGRETVICIILSDFDYIAFLRAMARIKEAKGLFLDALAAIQLVSGC